jgi:uncharacterized protein (TIGR03437 family)
MPALRRRITSLVSLLFLALMAGLPLMAYPVAVTINVTFVPIPGDPNQSNLGVPGHISSAVITATIDSAAGTGSSATYSASAVTVTLGSLTISNSGTVTINTNGEISAAFSSGALDSFSATLETSGLTLPTPSIFSFGTGSFSSPQSFTNYTILGSSGTVGVTGTISAVGLTASPLSGFSVSATQNGAAPASPQVTVTSTDTANPSQAYAATVSPGASWLTLTNATGTTPGTVTANLSTALSPGIYQANILVDTTTTPGAPIAIPITYTVSAPPAPVITSLNPSSATAGGSGFTLTVNGTGFLSGAIVQWNGGGLSTTFVGSTQLTATVPAGLIANAGSASITAVNTGGTPSTAVAFPIGAPTPTITSLSPASATAGGSGFTLTVNGTGFLSGATVQWNGGGLSTTFVGPAQLTATVPASLIASAGSASITAVNTGGTPSTAVAFPIGVPTPTITSLSPTSATAGGSGFTLTVNGTGFLSGATVQWNGGGLSTTFVGSTQLTATVPAGLIASAGSASITAVNTGGTPSTAVAFPIGVPTPTVTSLSPASATAGGSGFTLTVNGTGFLSGATVQWNGSGLSTTFVGSTQLTATVPASLIASAGSASITAINSGGSASTSATFPINAPTPTITSLSPTSVIAGGAAFTLTVNGTSFLSGAVVQWNGTGLTTTFVSSTQLTAAVPASLIASAGSASITAINSGGSASTAVALPIGVPTPTITSLSPVSATAGGAAFTLTINGTNFLSGAVVQWNGAALTTTFVSSTQLTAAVPASLIASAGSASITAVNTGGSASTAATFPINAPTPTITGLSPTSATAGGAAFTLTVNGTSFLSGAAVQWNGTALTTTFVSSVQLTAAVPANLIASAGNASITVVNAGGSASTAAILPINVPTPAITSLSPTSATAGGAAFTLRVNGTSFLTGAAVQWNGTALTTTFVSSVQLTAAVPASLIASPGSASITAINTGGSASAAAAFPVNVPTPAITSLSPVSATAGGTAFTLTVNGTSFLSGAVVQWNGTALTTTFVSSVQLTAPVPASLIASAGSASITAINSGGSASTAVAFPIGVPTPTINSLSPVSATAGGAAFTLTVNGTSFLSGAVVQWNGTALTTTFVSSTQLTAAVAASLIATAGSASITAINTGGSPSVAFTFPINAPTAVAITSLSPTSATAGGAAFTLTVNGTGFLSTATVQWNGTVLTTTFVSSTQLTAAVPASLIATAGSVNIIAANPVGSPSAPAVFPINAPTPTITSLSPTSATGGGAAFTLTVNGTSFLSGATVQWTGTALTTTFVSSIQLTAAVPASLIASAGSASITVVNALGSPSAAAAFPINAPTPVITSLSPTSAIAGDPTFTLTVNGTSFLSGASVQWNGTVLTTTLVSATQLTAAVPASLIAAPGSASITAINSGGSASTAVAFPISVPTPVISSLSPTSATAGGPAFTLTVNGTGFLSGATVQWNGTPLTTTFVSSTRLPRSREPIRLGARRLPTPSDESSTQLTAAVPASLIASAGNASITVMNSGGSASTAATFPISAPTPVISSLSPTSATAGGAAFTLTVNGASFLSGAAVQWNGTALTTTFVSSVQLTAAVPASLIASAGNASITVMNAGGSASTAAILPINVPTPAITSLSPTSATAGGAAFTLTVNGTSFLSGATVQWNGTALTTTFVSSVQLTAAVPASLIASAGSASITAINSGGSASTAVAFPIGMPTPTITSLSPVSATAGGAAFTLTVNGTNFLSGAVVQWNGTALTTTFVSSVQLTAAVPASLIASAGSASITAINSGGSASTAVAFPIGVPTPTITSLSPVSATAGGAAFTLTVNGTNFLSGAVVQWNGTSLTTTFVSSTQLTAAVAASLIASAGSASITAINTGGSPSAAAAFSINGPTPVITSLSPASATVGGAAFTLTLNGTGFLSGAMVQWNGTALTTTFVSSIQLTAAVPASLIASAGNASITAANTGGSPSAAATFPVNVPTPTITSLSPVSATAGGAAFTLTVNGTNFLSGAVVQWNGSALTTTFVNSTQLTAAVPASLIASAGTGSITAINTGGSPSAAVTFPINAPAPSITSLSPTSATAGGAAFTLTVNGTSFLTGATVRWNGTALTTTFVSATQLTAAVPANLIASTGSVSITAVNTGGSASSATAFAINAPSTLAITSLSPNSAIAGGAAFTLTVNGTGFVSGSLVQWNGSALATTFVSATQLTATVPASLILSAGSPGIAILNPDGSSSSVTTFAVSAPTITSLSQVTAPAGSAALTLTVNGTGFLSSSTVQWNGSALATTFVSSIQLIATVPANLIAATGSATVTVANSGGTASNGITFTITARLTTMLTGLSPNEATAGEPAFSLAVTGSGFDSSSTVQWNGSALSTTFVDSRHLTAAVPANLIAAPGAASVTVVTTGVAPSSALAFTIRSLAITTLSPDAVTPGGPAFTLIVNGTGFVSTSTVQFNGTALVTSFFNPTQLAASVPANLIANPGTANITVVNPGGLSTSPSTFAISSLTVTSLNPASAVAGGPAFTLTASGTGFATGASIQWNGVALSTTFVSSTQLTATITPGLIASAGTANVSVTSGGTTSSSLTFPIQTLALTTLSPAAGTAGSPAFTLAVNGAGFLPGMTVQWNGSPLPTTFVSAGQVLATVTANLIASSGTASVSVNSAGGPTSNTLSFPIATGTLTISTSSLAAATAGTPYSQSLTATGGTAPYSGWVVSSGLLPPGLTLDALAGMITGMPNSSTGSPYNFSVIVGDSTGAVSAAQSLSIAVNQPSALTIITTSPLLPGTNGVPYSQMFQAAGGMPPYQNWSVTAGSVPPNTTLAQPAVGSGSAPQASVQTAGPAAILSGTPTAPGLYSFTLQVTDSVGATFSKQFSVTINPTNTITIYSSGIVNSASYLGGSVAPGELVAIFGSGMGPVTPANLQLDNAGNLANALAGVQVLFDGVPAPLLYVSSTQIGAVVPYEVSGKTSTQVQVTWQGQASNTVSVPVASAAPGIYTLSQSGSGSGSVLNVDGTLNSVSNPTVPGSYVFVYATGEGQTNPPGVDGALNGFPAPIPSQMVTATIGGVPAYVQYAGGVASLVAGVIQINLQVPQGVTPGNSVPILINIGGATTQSGVTIAIQSH